MQEAWKTLEESTIMKKIIIILSIFILSLSSGFADSGKIYIPKDSKYIFSFDLEWANKNFSNGNESVKFLSSIKNIFKEKYSIDFDNDIKRVTFFNHENESFCYFSGNNVPKNIFSLSNKTLIPVDVNTSTEITKELNSLIEKGKGFVYIDGKSLLEVAGELVAKVTGMSSMKRMFTDIPAEVKQENPAFQMLDGIKYLLAFFDEDSIKVEVKCTDSDISEQVMNYLETFRTLYSSNLQKAIDGYREIMKKSNFADFAMISFTLYVHSKSKKFIDSIEISLGEEDETVAFIKTKFDIAYIIRSVASIKQSLTLDSEKFVDFETATEHMNKYVCHRGQRYLQDDMLDSYNLDMYHKEDKMISLDEKKLMDFIKEKGWHPLGMPYYKEAKEIPGCEFYSVGDLTKDGYIACKVHGSWKEKSKPVSDSSSSSLSSNSSSSNITSTTSSSSTVSATTSSSSNNSTSTQKNNRAKYDTKEYKPVKLKPFKTHPKVVVPEEVELEP